MRTLYALALLLAAMLLRAALPLAAAPALWGWDTPAAYAWGWIGDLDDLATALAAEEAPR